MAVSLVKMIRDEIRRVSRQEIRRALATALSSRGSTRKSLADLRRRISAMESAVKAISKGAPAAAVAEKSAAADAPKARITGKGVRTLRRKLRLSGMEFGKLLKVSSVTVYKWEKQNGPIRMRKASKAAFLAARGLGAREARQRLSK